MGGRIIFGGNDPNLGLTSPANDAAGQGPYARFPAGTPKYHGGNELESVLRQARFYITVGDRETFQRFRQAVPERARRILDVLTVESSARSLGFFDFFLESISSSRQEKMQVNEVLSDAYVAYFFGERAPMWSLSGSLLNTQQSEWYNAWHVLYDDILRGSQLARYGVPARLVYNDREVIGYITATNEMLTSQREIAATFQVQYLVKEVRIRRTYNTSNPSKGQGPAVNTIAEAPASVPQTTSTFVSGQEAASRLANAEAERVLPSQTLIEQVATGTFTSFVRPGANIEDIENLTGQSVSTEPNIFGSDLR